MALRNTRCLAFVLLLFAATTSTARQAEADLFEVWAAGQAGGIYGSGKEGLDFFEWARGGAAGVEAGIKVLFLGAYVDYTRFFGGTAGANLVGINLGGDSTIELGPVELVFRLAGTYYLGSLDNASKTVDGETLTTDDVHTQGFGARGGIGLRYPFFGVFSLGVTPQVGYHYFFTGGGPRAESSHGFDFQALAYLRLGIGF